MWEEAKRWLEWIAMQIDILLIQIASTWFMVGLIWLIQVVHYPLFAHVGRDEFVGYSVKHQNRITWIVAPVMLIELVTAGLLVFWPIDGLSKFYFRIALGLLIAVWISTAAVQVPQHGKLASRYDRETIHRLVVGNWLRTALWTVRGILVLLISKPLFI